MFDRFKRSRSNDTTSTGAVLVREPTDGDTGVREPVPAEREQVAEDTRVEEEQRFQRDEPTVTEPATTTAPPVVERRTLRDIRALQRDRFGGINWGSAFFGLLCAIGLGSILTAILVAAGVAIGLSDVEEVVNTSDAGTIGIGGLILLVVAVAIAWYCGGYVAGRMSRFDGVKQGMAVWLWTIALGAVLVIAAAIGGSEYNVLERLNLPNVPIDSGTLTTEGAIALGAALVVTLVAAIAGGVVGERYHRRVDLAAAESAADYERG